MWAFKTLWDKGLIYEGFRVLAYCWRCETPLSNTETRMDDVYHDRQDPALTVGVRTRDRRADPGVDDHTVDAAVEPGARRRAPTSTTRSSNSTACATSSPRRCSARTPPNWARRPRVGTLKGADLVGRTYTPLFDFFADTAKWGTEARLPGARRPTSSRPKTAPASCTWRPASVRTTRSCRTRPASRPSARWTSTASSPAEVGPWKGIHVFDANPLIIRGLEGTRRRAAPRHLRPLVSALLALRPAARVPGDLVVVRAGHRVPRPDGRTQRADHLAAGAPQGGQLRQVDRERPRLGDQPEPVLGVADPGVAVRRPGLPAHRRVRLDRRPRGRLRRHDHRPAPAVRRRADPPEPRRPDRAVDDAPRPRGARLLVRVGIDAVRPGPLPVREHASGSSTTTRATSSSSTSARPAAGSTRCTSSPRRCSTGPAFATCVSHGIVLGDDGQKMSKSLNNYPDPTAMFDAHGADAMRWSCCRRRSCAATTRWSPRPASATRSATCCSRCGTRGTSSRCTPTPPTIAATVRTDSTNSLDRTSCRRPATWSPT